MTTAARAVVVDQVLASREKNGVQWIARVGSDRGRLEVVGIVPASTEPTTIELLNERELLELLEGEDVGANTIRASESGS